MSKYHLFQQTTHACTYLGEYATLAAAEVAILDIGTPDTEMSPLFNYCDPSDDGDDWFAECYTVTKVDGGNLADGWRYRGQWRQPVFPSVGTDEATTRPDQFTDLQYAALV